MKSHKYDEIRCVLRSHHVICLLTNHNGIFVTGGEKLTLKERRESCGLRQADVAKKIEVVQTAVSKWESGCNVPLAKYQRKLAKLYKCTASEIADSVKETANERAEH